MDKKKSLTANKCSGGEKTSQGSNPSNSAVRRRLNAVHMVQNVLLIWLDNNIDDNGSDCRNTIIQLGRAVNNIKTFTNGGQCIQFLKDMQNNKACMVISGSLGQDIVPHVHDISQVDSIFIFCGNKKYHEQWAKEWSKIKGVFTEISPICEALKQVVEQYEQNIISISFIATNDDISKKKFDQLDLSFVCTKIFKEILSTIQFNDEHIKEFIQYCRNVLSDNESELQNVKKLERKYHDETPIWWYTYECFLYPMLNRALRLMDVDAIIKMGFFIDDLHGHIDQLHSKEFNGHHSSKIFTVYHGQGMSKADFEEMTKTKGGLMSFNSFLFTNKDRNVSLDVARRVLLNSDMIGILFDMTIDPAKSKTSFASIIDVSYYGDKEDEVLFSMNTVFRIRDINPLDENHRLFQVDLILTSDNDKDLRAFTDLIEKETFPEEKGWQRLGQLLNKMGQYEKSQQVYKILLEQTTDGSEEDDIYERLGTVKYEEGEYKEAIILYEKSLEIRRQSLSPNHLHLGGTYNNIGNAYRSIGKYSKALSYHEKALQIQQESLSSNHPDLAKSHNNIGNVYFYMSDYTKALSFYEKALQIQQQSLLPNHPDLAISCNNIGAAYEHIGNYSKANWFYERSVNIGQHSLPSNYPRPRNWRRNVDDEKTES